MGMGIQVGTGMGPLHKYSIRSLSLPWNVLSQLIYVPRYPPAQTYSHNILRYFAYLVGLVDSALNEVACVREKP